MSQPPIQHNEPMFVSSTFSIPGYKITQYIGLCFGVVVRSRGVAGDCSASCTSTCGGEVTAYTQMIIETRNQAIQRMIDDAARMGGNAVIGADFDSDQIGGQGMNNSAIIAYGTAVRVEPL